MKVEIEVAPVTAETWQAIEDAWVTIIRAELEARRVVALLPEDEDGDQSTARGKAELRPEVTDDDHCERRSA